MHLAAHVSNGTNIIRKRHGFFIYLRLMISISAIEEIATIGKKRNLLKIKFDH